MSKQEDLYWKMRQKCLLAEVEMMKIALEAKSAAMKTIVDYWNAVVEAEKKRRGHDARKI